jgi:hypothetical protein
MPPLYKEAFYWLVLLAFTAAAYLILMIFLGPIRAMGAFGFLGLAGLQPLLYRKGRQTVVWDERDTLVNYRAVLAGYSVFWLVFTLVPMSIWAVVYCYEGNSTISVHVLPLIVMVSSIVVWTTRAVAIVVQYHLQNASKEA